MKRWLYVTAVLLAGVWELSAQTPTAAQMKLDLVGHTMGGRQRCWKFQSTDQIKALTIKNEAATPSQCICIVALHLQATKAPAQYSAEARVAYTKTAAGWRLDHVGLLSLEKTK